MRIDEVSWRISTVCRDYAAMMRANHAVWNVDVPDLPSRKRGHPEQFAMLRASSKRDQSNGSSTHGLGFGKVSSANSASGRGSTRDFAARLGFGLGPREK